MFRGWMKRKWCNYPHMKWMYWCPLCFTSGLWLESAAAARCSGVRVRQGGHPTSGREAPAPRSPVPTAICCPSPWRHRGLHPWGTTSRWLRIGGIVWQEQRRCRLMTPSGCICSASAVLVFFKDKYYIWDFCVFLRLKGGNNHVHQRLRWAESLVFNQPYKQIEPKMASFLKGKWLLFIQWIKSHPQVWLWGNSVSHYHSLKFSHSD